MERVYTKEFIESLDKATTEILISLQKERIHELQTKIDKKEYDYIYKTESGRSIDKRLQMERILLSHKNTLKDLKEK